MARLFYTNIFSVIKSDGSAGAGWKLNFYLSGTTTRQNTYSDSGLTVPNANPVIADANGRFGPIWLSDVEYKCVLTDANDVVIDTSDPCDSNLFLTVNLTSFNETAAEAIAAQESTAANVVAAETAQAGAESARDAANSAAVATQQYFPAARSHVPQGAVTGAATISTAGSGGTNGTFDLAFSGGNFAVNPTGTFTVSGGAVTAITITGPGLYIGNAISKPTLSFAASAGLTGAAGTFNTVYLKTSGEYWLTDTSPASDYLSLFQNQANAAVEIDAQFDPMSAGRAYEWAESAGEPGGPGTKSAKGWADSISGYAPDIEDLKTRLPAPFSVLPLTHTVYSHAIVSENGLILAQIERATGKWKIALSDDAMLSETTGAALAASLADLAEIRGRIPAPFSVLPLSSPTYSHAIVSENGFTLARIERATGKWLLGLSDDAPVPDGWVASLLGGIQFDAAAQFSGYFVPFTDEAGNLLGGWKKDGTFRAAISDDSIVPVAPIQSIVDDLLAAPAFLNDGVSGPAITCVGDSITAGAGASSAATRYPAVLATLTGRTVYNLGVGGESARTIFGRVGAWPYQMRFTANTLPASGGAVVTFTSLDGQSVSPLLQGNAGLNPCYAMGIEGTLTYDSGTSTYTWTRTTAGDAITVKHPISLVTDARKTRMGDIIIANVGQNGGFADNDQLISMHDALFANMTSAVPRFLAVGRHTGTISSQATLNDKYQRRYGPRFVNMIAYLSSYAALERAGIVPTTDDDAAIAAGSLPNSFWASPTDSVHLNDAGYGQMAYIIHQRLLELGWI